MFNIEFWWLLAFPLFFAMGWVAARIDIRNLLRESRAVPESYFKGLNFLLNEQPDKAIEEFIEVARVDTQTVELHFALGNLFRRRGEMERAIRMHQSLIERSNLPQEQRLHATLELGQDYLRAGLLDRAEEIIARLRGTPLENEARGFLLEIYQQERDWAKAIAIVGEMPASATHNWQKEVAQYYCEMAAADQLHGRSEAAREHAEAALVANRRNVRANLILGDLAAAGGDHAAAIASWKRIEQQDPAFLALAAPKMIESYIRLGREGEGRQLLRGYLSSYPSLDMLDVAFRSIMEGEGAEAAYTLVREELRRNPTMLGLDKLLEAQILVVPPERRADLELIKNLIHGHTRRLARYRCDDCGFKARQFHWRCPGCGGWETYPPRRSEEFDLAP